MEIIFDFDGTIADTEKAVVSLINRIGPEYGVQKVTKKEMDIYHEIGLAKARKHFKISWWTFIRAGMRGQRELNNELDKVEIYPGVKKICKELKEKGDTLGVISSDLKKNIVDFLKKEKILEYFDYVESCGIVGSKSRLLKKMIRKRGLKKSEVWYVGDEIKDIVSAKKAGVRSIAVTWGYNSEKTLAGLKPDWLIKKPEELSRLINNGTRRLSRTT